MRRKIYRMKAGHLAFERRITFCAGIDEMTDAVMLERDRDDGPVTGLKRTSVLRELDTSLRNYGYESLGRLERHEADWDDFRKDDELTWDETRVDVREQIKNLFPELHDEEAAK